MKKLIFLWFLVFAVLYAATYFLLPCTKIVAESISVIHPVSYTVWLLAFLPYIIGFYTKSYRWIVFHAIAATMFIFAAVMADKEGACEVGRSIFWGMAVMSMFTLTRKSSEAHHQTYSWLGFKLVALGLCLLYPACLEFFPLFK
ncbi:MAG: hypothetical protein WC227_02295 [Patescibacteria group bacterium]